jgi:hypothetical protein
MVTPGSGRDGASRTQIERPARRARSDGALPRILEMTQANACVHVYCDAVSIMCCIAASTSSSLRSARAPFAGIKPTSP